MQIIARIIRSGIRYYSENPLDLVSLIVSFIALGLSSVVLGLTIWLP